MMNFKKLMSLFLAVLMLCGVMTSLSVIPAAADDAAAEEGDATESVEETTSVDSLYTEIYASPEEKLATMELMTTKENFAIYARESSGEVAVKNLATGQILFTNPYDVGAATASDSVKNEILSQIIVKFDENGRERIYSSFEYAAMRDQIKIKNIKNGIRVEYTIGREEARRLVPRMIEKSRFETLIQAPMEEYYGVTYEDAQVFRYEKNHPLASASFYLCKQMSYFVYKDKDECTSDRLLQDLLDAFPIVDKMDIYVLDKAATTTEIEKIEEVIKTACPNYSYEEMDYDHQLTEYTGEEENPPVFKMALEYTLDEDGFSVRLPANGIRFNESKFQLTNVSVLPYMGAGNNTYSGYTFYPDGSGALFAFEDLVDQNTYTVASKVYGVDYAYHQISGTYQQTVRYPVFGIVENTEYYDCLYLDEEAGVEELIRISSMIYDDVVEAQEEGQTNALVTKYGGIIANSAAEKVSVDRGYVAIIEEGDALTELVTYHAGVLSPYDTVQMNFNPRPKDSYNIADAISVGSNSEWSVVSNRKYVGNYKIRYVMLSDENIAAENQLPADRWYEATWLGMAKAYRDYLVDKGILNQLEATSDDIPLYIESFGAVETVEKFLSIPVEVMKPLTSTEDVVKMYEELSAAGATNINFKLTGFANGGVYYSTMPYKLKWEKAVQTGAEKDISMQELFDYAAGQDNLTLFPEFEFSYMVASGMFDGFSSRQHAVRTIDDRYTYERPYKATQQKYASSFRLAVSPAYYAHFYEKLLENYLGYANVNGISVGSFGTALNSDFDEDEPYNREDSKGFIAKALEYISGSKDGMDVMVDGGNAYTWQYADHILNAPLDSSRYIKASYSVPFLGVVLHGYKNFAGAPLNMEGDLNYAKLKAIENGASIYFTLSYQNTQILKEDINLNRYYSIRYDIWKDDVIEIYNEINDATKDVQNMIITDHQFLSGMRVPDVTELDRDSDEVLAEMKDFLDNKAEYEILMQTQAVADARDTITSLETTADNFVKNFLMYYTSSTSVDGRVAAANAYMGAISSASFSYKYATYVEAKAAYDQILAEYEAADADTKADLEPALIKAETAERGALVALRTLIRDIGYGINMIRQEAEILEKLYVDAQAGKILIDGTADCPESIKLEIKHQLATAEARMNDLMGVNFNMTVDRGEVDTVLRTHAATLFLAAYGESNHAGVGMVGKAENLYNILYNNDYGLRMEELDLLRYLEANKKLTDDELIAKYGLSREKSSVDGLLKFVKELLGLEGENAKFQFDPVILDIDAHVSDYITDIIFSMISAQSAKLIVSLNFSATYPDEEGRLVSNTANNNVVIAELDKVINEVILGDKGFGSVESGSYYDFDVVFDEKTLNDLIDDCVEIIEKRIRSEKNPVDITTGAVEYATPATLEQDLLNYCRSKFYRQAIDRNFTLSRSSSTLEILGTADTTAESFEVMLKLYCSASDYKDEIEELDVYDINGRNHYALLMDAIMADLEGDIGTMILRIYDEIKDTYTGEDVLYSLVEAFIQALATDSSRVDGLNKDFFVKDLSSGSNIPNEPSLEEGGVTLRERIKVLVNQRVPTLNLDNIDDFIVELQEVYHDDYGLNHEYCVEEGHDVKLIDYVYYSYFHYVANKDGRPYYYDNQLAQVDIAIVNQVAAMKPALLAALPEDYNIYDITEVVLHTLASAENPVYDFTDPLAATITHVPTGKNSHEKDVLSLYIYELLNCFEGHVLPEVAAIEGICYYTDKNGVVKFDSGRYEVLIAAAQKVLDEKGYVDEMFSVAKSNVSVGVLTDYSFSALGAQLGSDYIDKVVGEMYDAMKATRRILPADEEKAAEVLIPGLKDFLAHQYYMLALGRLRADQQPTFHVAEVYSDNLKTSTQNLEDLMIHFATSGTGMNAEDVRSLYSGFGHNLEDEDEGETSRYLSDDGRIVAVTYGSKNADGSYNSYKTFVLNYNNFAVSVVYDGVTYTIPAYGYVIVMH